MLNNKDTLLRKLQSLNLGTDEAQLYLELLKEPATHLKLARTTGINRSKVYRLADQLEKRSLVSVRSDDRGTFLVASDPATLEVELVAQEEELKRRREVFESLVPTLGLMQNNDTSSFIVHTYEGDEGFKQMLWHELKAKGENYMFGCGSLNELIDNKHWTQQHIDRVVEAGYHIRMLINPGELDKIASLQERYEYRILPQEVLVMRNQISTYNDTVAIYHWRERQKVGLEVINRDFARIIRQMFEGYWLVAQPPK